MYINWKYYIICVAVQPKSSEVLPSASSVEEVEGWSILCVNVYGNTVSSANVYVK